MTESVVIDARFNGPPDSGNGGYTCGALAELAGEAVEVSLRRPPPLGHELTLEQHEGGAALRDGDDVVAEAVPVELELDPPAAPSLAEAEEAGRRFPFVHGHPFPTCFVCGPERTGSDGLRIFPGPLGREGMWASTWTPAAEYADGGAVAPRVVWAALDCPTSFPLSSKPGDTEFKPIVLASLAVRRLADVAPGEPYVIAGWPIEIDGRKRRGGAALYTAGGDLVAYSRALWIQLRTS